MCVIDLEVSDCWSEVERKARTPKKCACCYAQISPGDRYIKHFSKFDGHVWSSHLCKPCDADRAKFAAEHDHMLPNPESFYQMLADCVSEDEEDEDNRWAPMLAAMKARGKSGTETVTN